MTRRPPMPLAARVAKDVIQWKVCPVAGVGGGNCPIYRDFDGSWMVWRLDDDCEWDPLANPADLLDVIEAMHARNLDLSITLDPGGAYVEIVGGGELRGHRQERVRGGDWRSALARAVCRAALEAVK